MTEMRTGVRCIEGGERGHKPRNTGSCQESKKAKKQLTLGSKKQFTLGL